MGDWVFGCDICQEVCPWNRFAQTTDQTDFHPRDGLANPDTHALIASDKDAFDTQFIGTPVRRAKHEGMVRNARIVAQNQRDTQASG